MTGRDEFEAGYPFSLDGFQRRAFDALDAGRSVLVAAPTGSGKTVVGEYAVARALAEGGKAFYTTPLKALSNQKFGELARRYGAERVGLLTGDNSINGDAPVVVMTTEVLRNMIYAGSSTLEGLRTVVLDEVHYLQDRYRGPVWEEVIVHSPPQVRLVCLSATVSNAEEVADWVQTVRGPTTAIIEESRPVELQHHYMVGERDSDHLHLLPTFVDGAPNPEAARLDSRSSHSGSRSEGPLGPGGRERRYGRPRLHAPRRAEVVERLRDESMLPAIYFIFSRAACDDAVRQCLDAGLRLTTDDERLAIRAIAEHKAESLSDEDLSVLRYGRWLQALECGLAAHHAGMVPPFKEATEACFAAGLVKAVFATETLALGINMPARSVVIEKLSKFTGERHEFLTPGEYTQLTGRAGRRGIDDVGHAVVLWSPFVPFDQVAGLASRRTYELSSSFRPTYNMATNLVRRYPSDAAHHLLNLSFAQYRVDREVVRLESQLEKDQGRARSARAEAVCERGDVEEYRRLQRAAQPGRRAGEPASGSARAEVDDALGMIRPGDVLVLSGGKSAGPVVVLSTGSRRGGMVRLGVLTVERRYLTLGPRDFDVPPRAVSRLRLPTPHAPRRPAFQRAAARDLGRLRVTGDNRRAARGRRAAGVAAELAAHPVRACPDVGRHMRAAARAERLEGEVSRLERRIHGRTESLARQFDRVLRVLETWGYLDDWSLTESGEDLVRLYHECDLLVAEAMRTGLFDGLEPNAMAAMASGFTYESRGPAGPAPTPWFPSARLRRQWADVERLARDLNAVESEAGLPLTRSPDPGFFAAAYGWAAGENLADVIAEQEIPAGDFVRNIKQLVDLLGQIGQVAREPATAKSAREAADRLFRGIVAASSVVAA